MKKIDLQIRLDIKKKAGLNKKIGIIQSIWNTDITNRLYSGCHKTLVKYGVNEKNIKTMQVPGSFELIYGAKNMVLNNPKIDAIIVIGSIIKGETPHFNFISQAVANGIKDLNILFNIPFVFCVSTDLNNQQALDRAGGNMGNKGIDAAHTTLQLLQTSY